MVLPVKAKLGNSFLRMGTKCAWTEVVFNGMTSDTGTRSDVGTRMSGVDLTCCQLHPPINDGELKDCFATGCHHVSEIDSSLSISNQHWAVQQPTNLELQYRRRPWCETLSYCIKLSTILWSGGELSLKRGCTVVVLSELSLNTILLTI